MGSTLKHKSLLACACVAAGALFAAQASQAAVIYTTPGSTYSQNFDSLPITPENVSLGNTPVGWTNDNPAPAAGNFSIPGWYLFHPLVLAEGGFDGHQRMRIGAGTANTGGFMSFGASASTERALGAVVSGTTVGTAGQEYFALRLTNNVGYTLLSFTLSYDGEQWRDGGNAVPAAKTWNVQYSTTATAINDSAVYNATTGLDWTTPVNGTSAAAVNGNTTGKVSVGPTTITGLQWTPGTDLWIRWVDPRAAGNNPGMALDNVSFSAVPEPTSMMLVAGACLFGALRRRRAR
jgi:hypothetical protein